MTDTTAQAADAAVFELYSPEGIANPYPIYHRLRELSPLHLTSLGFRVATRYEDCVAILRDHNFIHDVQSDLARKGYQDTWQEHPSMVHFWTNMLIQNPPEHTRLRRLVNRAFTPRTVEKLRPQVEARVKELLDDIAGGGEVEFISAVAYPLPVSVIGDLVGVPRSDLAPFGKWVEDWSNQLELIMTEEGLAAADKAAQEMFDYFMGLLAERRRQPQDDLLSGLLAAEDDGERLTDDEIVHMLMLVFSAGFDTTTHLIGNGVAAFMEFPDQMELLRSNRELMPGAVEEMLRYDTSIQVTFRQASADVDVNGVKVAEGETALAIIGAANRDPERFPDPDRFDITREDNHPLSFGYGVHYCLGAALARMETELVFDALFQRFSAIEPAGDPERRVRMNFRALNALPLRLTPA